VSDIENKTTDELSEFLGKSDSQFSPEQSIDVVGGRYPFIVNPSSPEQSIDVVGGRYRSIVNPSSPEQSIDVVGGRYRSIVNSFEQPLILSQTSTAAQSAIEDSAFDVIISSLNQSDSRIKEAQEAIDHNKIETRNMLAHLGKLVEHV
jgi:hypothetical protein